MNDAVKPTLMLGAALGLLVIFCFWAVVSRAMRRAMRIPKEKPKTVAHPWPSVEALQISTHQHLYDAFDEQCEKYLEHRLHGPTWARARRAAQTILMLGLPLRGSRNSWAIIAMGSEVRKETRWS